MRDFASQLHITYQKSIKAFTDNLRSSDIDLPKQIDSFCRTCVMCLWASFNVDPSLCVKPLSEMYTRETDRVIFTLEEVKETFEYIRSNNVDVKIPEFYTKIIELDKTRRTAHSRIFAEGMKMIFINCALIDDELSFEEARAITRYSQILSDECDRNGIRKADKTVDAFNYIKEKEGTESTAMTADNKQLTNQSPDTDKENIVLSGNPLDELNNLIGLKTVKKEIESIRNLVKVQQLRQSQGLPMTTMSYHLVFTGNPGTGKTTVARIVAQIFKELGVLSKGQLIEVKSSDLIAGYAGQTAIKTHDVIKSAIGGVLFIDEAYTLVDKGGQGGYGQEAIDTLLKEMEDHRDDLIVIVAGYDNLMSDFIDSNPGLKSRFNKYIHFDDYTAEELNSIFVSMCEKNKYLVDDHAREVVKEYFSDLSTKKEDNFGNGRDVRNFFEKTITKQANRVAELADASLEDLMTITSNDIDWDSKTDAVSVDEALAELDGLIGLDTVKKEIRSLVDLVKVQKMRREQGLSTPKLSLHMVFSGNPGTGKTTVARCVAGIYKALGLLSEGQLVETDRAGLVAGYVGQTAEKTKKVIKKAIGGVLFIDEAYTLASKGSNDFGQEAIDTLLKEMEDNRDNLVVIIAGYDDQIGDFISSNPGLESRFNRYIHFDDYLTDELLQIFKNYCVRNQYQLAPDAERYLVGYFDIISGAVIGNGRGVRNIFEKTVNAQASRVAAGVTPPESIAEITLNDIMQACGGSENG